MLLFEITGNMHARHHPRMQHLGNLFAYKKNSLNAELKFSQPFVSPRIISLNLNKKLIKKMRMDMDEESSGNWALRDAPE